jgi:transposase-like protein
MQFFNMALHTLADMKEHHDAMVCFNLYYVEQADNVKRLADQLGISRPTYYNRVKSFARKAFALSQSLKKAHFANEPSAAPDQELEKAA